MTLINKYPHFQTIQQLAKKKKVDVFLVGGFVRDCLLNRPKLDFDFAVERGALKFAGAFAREIKGAFIVLDEERGCARVAKKTKEGMATFDFADFRAKTFKADLSLRDFTVNTLAVDMSSLNGAENIEEVLLDFKQGLKDLKARRIKLISARAFKDDPLRMLRAFSIKAALGFTIDKNVLSQIKKDKGLIRGVSYERIREELFKILESGDAAGTMKAMDQIGLLKEIIPQITVMYNCHQGGYHHLDVWPHSLETVKQLENVYKELENDGDVRQYINVKLAGEHTRKALIKLAALLHDIGKPETRKKEENGRISFHGHEHVGKNIARHIAKMLKISTKERYALEDMIRWHLRPGYLADFKNPSERAVFRFFRDAKEETASILILSMADQRSTCGPMTTKEDTEHHVKICRAILRKYFDKLKEKPFVRLVNGNDVMKYLKLPPSPLVGKILREIEEKQVLGKIQTKKDALELAKKIVK